MWEAKQLLEKRAKDGISAKQLATMLGRGASKENVYKWEKGVVRPKSKGMSKKVQNYINGTLNGVAKKVRKKTNGAIKKDEYKEKFEALREEHFVLLKKYTILLENKP